MSTGTPGRHARLPRCITAPVASAAQPGEQFQGSAAPWAQGAAPSAQRWQLLRTGLKSTEAALSAARGAATAQRRAARAVVTGANPPRPYLRSRAR
jgi:hypothetical protein